jgi:hypothetical protein
MPISTPRVTKSAFHRNAIAFRDGTIELDMAGTPKTNFMGIAFHATDVDNSEVVFFRIGSSGTSEAVQYGPALNGRGAAWQVYHGDGANAVATLIRNEWMHVKIDIAGSEANTDHLERLHFGYSDGVVIFCNGTPLYFGMNAPFFRDLGVMDEEGDAVYLPLKKGKNEIVFAVTEYSGGSAFFGRLDR